MGTQARGADNGYLGKTIYLASPSCKDGARNEAVWARIGAINTRDAAFSGRFGDARVLAAFLGPDRSPCLATSMRFTRSDYHMALRWFFRFRFAANPAA